MKKVIICLLLTMILFHAVSMESQENEPVYIHDIYPHLFVGPLICEYAINGDINILRMIEPYIQNDRLYFTGLAFPISTGSLRTGFEFNVDFFEDNPRIKAVYQGSLTDPVSREDEEEGLLVAGYAQPGSIIITHVFFDLESADGWANTVRMASD